MGETVSTGQAVANSGGGEYPKSWIFDEDGDLVEGTFVKFDRASTRDYGAKVILVLDVAGVERSIWLTQTVLFGQVRDELQKRPAKTLEPGERVVVKRLGKKDGANGRSYWNFRVLFPDAPVPSTSEMFGLDGGRAAAGAVVRTAGRAERGRRRRR